MAIRAIRVSTGGQKGALKRNTNSAMPRIPANEKLRATKVRTVRVRSPAMLWRTLKSATNMPIASSLRAVAMNSGRLSTVAPSQRMASQALWLTGNLGNQANRPWAMKAAVRKMRDAANKHDPALADLAV